MSLLGVVVYLVAIWILLWGDLSLANVASGVVVAVVLLAVFPTGQRSRPRHPIRPWPALRLALYFVGQLLRSNLLLSRQVLSPWSRVHTGIVGVPVVACSDTVLALIANITALTPGTMAVEVIREPATIYIHVLRLRDVEQVRAEVARLNALAVRALGSAADVAALEAASSSGERP